MKKVQLDKSCAMELVAAEPGRSVIDSVRIKKVGDAHVALATDARRLVVVALGGDTTLEKYRELSIPKKMFAKIRKARKAPKVTRKGRMRFRLPNEPVQDVTSLDVETIVMKGEERGASSSQNYIVQKPTLHRLPDASAQGQYPDVIPVFPKDDLSGRAHLSINARFLYELAQAMGDETVTLHIKADDPCELIVVSPVGKELAAERIGILMPIRAEGAHAAEAMKFIRQLKAEKTGGAE